MKPVRNFFAFKYKLSVLLFAVVLSVSSFLGIFQYVIMRSSLIGSFEQSKKLIKDRVINILHDADYINLLIERPLEREANEVLEAVVKKYAAEGSPNFDLEAFRAGKENLNLYIIDEKNTIIAATDNTDLGLDFTPWPDFVRYLEKVRKEKVFSAARMSLSVKEAKMMKYCYMPSPDGEYIFETGALIEEGSSMMEGIGFHNFEEKVVQDNTIVDSVVLFDYEGVSYKKNTYGENMKVSPEYMAYFTQALQSMQTLEVIGEYKGGKTYYQYVPYQIIGAQGANERNVVEIVYNDSVLQENLETNVKTIITVVLIGAVLAASLGFYKARIITRPIEAIMEGVKQVSEGNLNFSVRVDSNDEFSLLGSQFGNMTGEIKNLLDERYRIEKDMERKNKEIFDQKEEISALYEETTALNEELESMLRQNQNSYFETVRALANAVEEKDSYTGGHCERVMEYSLMIAETLGLSKQELNELKFGSILHDIGKIGIPESILNKEGILSEAEYGLIKRHPEIGDRILENLHFLDNCRKIILEHHERVDGRGYPNGLSGSRIDLLARIVCVADAYDAMTSSRPYRKNAMPKERAVQELLENRGLQFDEKIVDAFISALNQREDEKGEQRI